MLTLRHHCCLSIAVLALLGAGGARADEPVAETTIAASDSGLSELVTKLVAAQLPDQYEKKKNWGATKEVWDGVDVKLDGLRLRTKRKKRTVNHGTWTLYQVRLRDPNQFAIRVSNIRRLDDGRVGFEAEFEAPLDIFARLSEWQLGVQLISLSADCEARVRLSLSCAVATRIEAAGKLIPDVVFVPEVTAAHVVLQEFRLHRLSQLHGPLAKHLGSEAREVLEDELAERNREIAAKINRQITKKEDRLRISLSDLATTKFGDLRAWVTSGE